MSGLVRRQVLPLLLGGLMIPPARAEDTKFHLRCSVDTSATHGRTVYVGEYLKELEKASGGRIETELFHSGQLYRDRDIGKAMRQATVDMSVPGTWELTGFVPDADVVWMPPFFGRNAQEARKITDGPIGDLINQQLEKALNVKIIGTWFELGLTNFATLKKQVIDAAELKGMKVRVSGGTGQFLHVKYFGAQPDLTAWPDVPLALSQGMFDGLVSSNESMSSAKLWEAGVRYVFLTRESMASYVPMVTQRFWDKLPPDLQKLVVDLWAKNNPRYRDEMEQRQINGRKTMEEHGVVFTEPSKAQIAEVRAGMARLADGWAKEMKISDKMMTLLKDVK